MAIDATIALISLADAKAFLKITAASEDTIVADLVNECSAWVQNFVGHPLISAQYIEYYNGDGTVELILRNFPVTTLTEVNIDLLRQFNGNTIVPLDTSVILDKGSGIIRLWNYGPIFLRGQANVKVTYTAGYALAAIPYPIQLAVRKMVSFLYRSSYAMPKVGVQTETVGDRTTTYFNDAILKDVEHMLKPYQNVGHAGGFA